MADYEPLIARAVAGLEHNTGENRRVLYERARSALVSQLRGVDPPLEEADITRERQALEEAIRKIEADAAAKEQAESPPPEPGTRGGAAGQPAPLAGRQGLRSFRESMARGRRAGRGVGRGQPRRARNLRLGVRRNARRRAGAGKPTRNPLFRARGRTRPAAGFHRRARHDEDAGRYDHAEHGAPAGHARATRTCRRRRSRRHAEEVYAPPARSYGRLIAMLVVLLVVLRSRRRRLLAARHHLLDGGGPHHQRAGDPAGVGARRAGGQARGTAQDLRPHRPLQQHPAGHRAADSDNAAGQPQQPATAPTAAVAQKVVLYEEDPKNPQGKRYVGSAIWRTETVSPGPGLAPELAVRADVEIPERHLRMTWSLRRNTDKALPASHTIEITFTLPADFEEGGIGNVPGVLMKNSEQARGIPLAGLSVKVTNGYFLIGLSSVDVDKQRNIDLLKTRGWFDIPIVFTSGKRAILAMEKGPPGDRAFEEAFRAWGE